jgi:nitrate/nitrite-specific signal transduction histidine kinase
MLSRTAENLYWLARYVERADFVSRLIDATLRLAALPSSYGGAVGAWSSALTAAGIEPELPFAVDGVPPDRQELFGWAVREGSTNVVRHSGAKRCWIRLTASEVETSDDGAGPVVDPDAGVGHGLSGLRERASAAGGTLTVGRRPEGGFTLRVSVP